MNDHLATFSRRFDRAALTRLRLWHGYSIERLNCLLTGYRTKRHRIAAFEDGTAIPKISSVKKLCSILGCELDQLAPRITLEVHGHPLTRLQGK